MEQHYSTAATAIGSSGIQRILIEDASSQVMPKPNADAFPAHGTHYGKTAGVKIDLSLRSAKCPAESGILALT
jgi:hypothetical protein